MGTEESFEGGGREMKRGSGAIAEKGRALVGFAFEQDFEAGEGGAGLGYSA